MIHHFGLRCVTYNPVGLAAISVSEREPRLAFMLQAGTCHGSPWASTKRHDDFSSAKRTGRAWFAECRAKSMILIAHDQMAESAGAGDARG